MAFSPELAELVASRGIQGRFQPARSIHEAMLWFMLTDDCFCPDCIPPPPLPFPLLVV